MSEIIATYDPSAVTTDTFVTRYLSSGIGSLVMWNDSDWLQDITFPNGDTDVLPAWTAVKFLLQGPSGQVSWKQDTQLMSVNQPPISQVKVVAYRQSEEVPGVYPVALVRQTTTANVVNTVGGIASGVQNDANTSGASVVEATVAGDNASAVSLVNNGHLLLGTTANDGLLQITTSGGSKKVTVATDGTLTVDKGIVANLITAETGNDLGHHVAAGQRVVDTINGVDVFSANSSGANLLSGTLNLLLGSMSRISKFTGTANTTPTFFNHGLGAVPDIVLPIGNGTSSTLHSFFVDYASLTSTQAKITNDSAGGTPFVALAIKF